MASGGARIEERFTGWIGRKRDSEEVLSAGRARLLAATLDGTADGIADGTADSEIRTGSLTDGDPLPPGWHWIYFNDEVAGSALADDGHERRGGFLPPIPLSKRMWAGGRLRFHAAPRLGSLVRRTSTIRSIDIKEGRSGPLAFVTVAHTLTDGDELLVEEEQDIVYLDRTPDGGTADAGPRDGAHTSEGGTPEDESGGVPPADWTESFMADEIVLFRFSALTFNAHRIHYDLPYATEGEGYPGLVVHGPLLALLLLNAGLRRTTGFRSYNPAGTRFSYRALQPVFCNEALLLRGSDASHEAAAGAGVLALHVDHPVRGTAMRASLAVFAPGD